MSNHEFRQALLILKMSVVGCARMMEVHRATVYRWLDGAVRIPRSVEIVIRNEVDRYERLQRRRS